LRILHISSPISWRGGERQVFYLMQGLENNGHENFLMTPKHSIIRNRSNLNNSHILDFRKGAFSLFRNLRILNKYCVQNQIELIHGHDSHAHTLLWMAYRFGRLRIKSLITRRFFSPIKSRSIQKYNCDKIEKIICISEAVKKAISPSINDLSRLTVIHSAIDTVHSKDKERIGQNNKEFNVGYVAAFTKEKDHETFIAVAKNLLDRKSEVQYKFILVGSGPLLESIKEKSLDIKDHVNFTGFIEDVASAYIHMDLLLHTSKTEALGTSILDAMKYGIPIVATNIGGIPEIIDHNQNGFLCQKGDFEDMAEQVFKISTDKDLRQKFIDNSTDKLRFFDKSTMVNKTIKIYQNLLDS